MEEDKIRRSLSARRAWIEIFYVVSLDYKEVVALRKESVDRNYYYSDKNADWVVALRKESVDRNVNLRVLDGSKSSSLSARRAWIEILIPVPLL